MVKPNEQFTLSVSDIELIENALRYKMHTGDDQTEATEINRLLGRIRQQKHFYRPKEGYVSG